MTHETARSSKTRIRAGRFDQPRATLILLILGAGVVGYTVFQAARRAPPFAHTAPLERREPDDQK